MRTYHIEGGYRLSGDVIIGGSKNAALAIIAAAMVVDGPCVIKNLPEIRDIDTLLTICADQGAEVVRERSASDRSAQDQYTGDAALMEAIRAPIFIRVLWSLRKVATHARQLRLWQQAD